MPSGDAYRVGIVWDFAGAGQALTTFGLVEGAGGAGPDPMTNVADDVISTLGGSPIAGWADTTTIQAVIVSNIQPGTYAGVRVPTPILGGSVADDSLPGQDCLVVHWSTGLKGKANMGRMYLSGFPESGQVRGFWNSDVINPASAFASLIFDEYVSDATNYQLSVMSYVPGSSPRALRAAVPVTAFTVDNIVRSMRSRQVGRGM